MHYVEKSWGYRRNFSVENETLIVTGKKFLSASFKLSFSLNQLKSQPDEHRVRDDTRAAVLGMPSLLAFAAVVGFGTEIYAKNPALFWILLGGTLAAVFFTFIFGGKIKVYTFKGHNELALIEISNRGNSESEFESFVDQLKEKIRAANLKS
jgi:hypothetical protein